MTPKEYLQRVERLDILVGQKVKELELMRKYPISSKVMEAQKVQTSKRRDGVLFLVERLIKKEDEVNAQIDRLIDLRKKVIGEIQSLDNMVYVQILYKRYIEYKSLGKIAEEMHYSYDRVKHLHGIALQAFGRKVDTQ